MRLSRGLPLKTRSLPGGRTASLRRPLGRGCGRRFRSKTPATASTTPCRVCSNPSSTKERGSGLGLAVVKQIVESFGGKIHVYSKVNEGTRMEVWLLEARGQAVALALALKVRTC
ncbi:MAG: ATP-binding protein [Gemmataceae bacterium]|nr:ATP-binding protein [Gemmataceae bacterium]MCI0737414.1 ATP-binding protein [Gemmataceae bacterium]